MSDPHKPLRDDVRLLGELLGDTVRAQAGEAIFATVERVRALAKSARAGHDADFRVLADELSRMAVDDALPIARAFAHFLHLANIAEQHHRVRRRRAYLRDPAAAPQRGSCADGFARLLAAGITPDRLHDAVSALQVELVLTAHPTEVARRRLVQKHNRIAAALAQRDRPDLTAPERDDLVAAIRREIQAAWGTSDVREQRPTPIDEVRSGLIVFEQSLWDALPPYRAQRRSGAAGQHRPRAADRRGAAAVRVVDRRRPRRQPERHAGGDAPGLAAVALGGGRAVPARHRSAARRAVDRAATEELRARVPGSREPYRELLRGVRTRLVATRDWIEASLAGAETLAPGPDVYLTQRRSGGGSASVLTARSRRPDTGSSPTGGSPTCCAASPRSASRWRGSTSGRTRRATPTRWRRSPRRSDSARTRSGTKPRGWRSWCASCRAAGR